MPPKIVPTKGSGTMPPPVPSKSMRRLASDDYDPSQSDDDVGDPLDRVVRQRDATRPDIMKKYAEYLARDGADEALVSQLSQQFSQQVDEDEDIDIDTEGIMGLEDLGVLSEEDLESYSKYASLVETVDKDGFDLLIGAAFDAEINSGSGFGKDLKDHRLMWFDLCQMTLCGMPAAAIPHIVTGTLTKAVLTDSELMETLDDYRERADDHPCIYVRCLSDKDGNLMPIDDAERLWRHLLLYANVPSSTDPQLKAKYDAWIYKVDHEYDDDWKKGQTVAGERKRLQTLSGDPPRMRLSDKRVKCLHRFCDALKWRIDAAEKANLTELKFQYVGYAIKAGRRQQQHEACGASSNWLATLVQSTCNVLFDRRYQIGFFPVCLLGEEQQGFIAEIFLTRIASAYYHTGSGFCIDIAGKSMTSLKMSKLSKVAIADKWQSNFLWLRENTELDANLEAQVKFREERNKRIKARLDEELAAEKAKVVEELEKTEAWEKAYHLFSDSVKEAYKGDFARMMAAREKLAGILAEMP